MQRRLSDFRISLVDIAFAGSAGIGSFPDFL
jgi:hypothetical protein